MCLCQNGLKQTIQTEVQYAFFLSIYNVIEGSKEDFRENVSTSDISLYENDFRIVVKRIQEEQQPLICKTLEIGTFKETSFL